MDLVLLTVLGASLLALGPMLFSALEQAEDRTVTPRLPAAPKPAAKLSTTARALLVVALLTLATVVSVVSGTPATLPGVSMGSDVLLHLQRGTLGLGLLGTALLVGWRATLGDYPLKFGPWLEYADKAATEQAKADTTEALDKQQALIAKYRQESQGQLEGVRLMTERLYTDQVAPLELELQRLQARVDELGADPSTGPGASPSG